MKFGRQEKAQAKFVEDWNRDFQVGTEVVVIKSLTKALPRHMPVYDWNLPYAEGMIRILRREFVKMVENPKPEKEDIV